MTKNAISPYRGRFAPSPSGPLHFGSLIAALGSFLHAKINNGQWLVRIEDIDQTRIAPNAADDILRTLEALELHWDESVRYQTQHLDLYDAILDSLLKAEKVYCCDCSRKMIKAMGGIYDKRCRHRHDLSRQNEVALRFKNDLSSSRFWDDNLGWITPEQRFVEDDVVLKRRDGLHAYQLVVVADDIAQDITHVIRGADLLDLTPVQQTLFHTLSALPFSEKPTAELLSFQTIVKQRQQQNRCTPHFLHLPLAVSAPHQKLSKQNHAPAINLAKKEQILHQALLFLGVSIPAEFQNTPINEQLAWSITHNAQWRFKQQTEILYSE